MTTTQIGTFFQVQCTLVSNLPLNTWVVKTQFSNVNERTLLLCHCLLPLSKFTTTSSCPMDPLGVTYGFNGPHAVDPQLFIDMAAANMSRVRLNVVMDLLVTPNPADPPSKWNWGFLDAAVLLANKAGIRVTLIARGLKPNKSAWTVRRRVTPRRSSTTRHPQTTRRSL